MAGYIGSKSSVTQVDGYNKTEADAEFVQVAGDTMTGDLTVTKAGTPIIADRTGSDGPVLDLKKDGSTVGSIGAQSGKLQINGSSGTGFFLDTVQILPKVNGALADNQADLGSSGYRFNELWLGGGVYLGGTGSANKLDDVEFGDWTPTVFSGGGGFSGTVSVNHARYRKIGRTVWVDAYISVNVSAVGSGEAKIGGLPFTVQGGYSPFKAVHGDLALSNGGYFNNGNTTMTFIYDFSVSGRPIAGTGVRKVMISGHYDT